MAKSRKSKEWNKANIRSVAKSVKKSEAEMFEEYAERHHTTRSKILHDYIRYCIFTDEPPISYDKKGGDKYA